MGKQPEELRTLEDFREFFAEIPEHQWTTGYFVVEELGVRKCCAQGHLGQTLGKDQVQPVGLLTRLLSEADCFFIVTTVNDTAGHYFPQRTPKQRILALIDRAIWNKKSPA